MVAQLRATQVSLVVLPMRLAMVAVSATSGGGTLAVEHIRLPSGAGSCSLFLIYHQKIDALTEHVV